MEDAKPIWTHIFHDGPVKPARCVSVKGRYQRHSWVAITNYKRGVVNEYLYTKCKRCGVVQK